MRTYIHKQQSSDFNLPARNWQAARRDDIKSLKTDSANPGTSRFDHDFTRIPLHSGSRAKIQAKLKVNTAGDAYEQEADSVAEKILNSPEPQQLQKSPCKCGGKCSECQTKPQGDQHLQTKHIHSSGPEAVEVPNVVNEVIASSGQPLDASTRSFMESRFGHDFSRVRIHDDQTAAASAYKIGARAYTVGRDIVFGKSEYMPHSAGGRQLLAHELTHVVQQQGATHSVQRAPDPAQVEAEALEKEILANPIYKKLGGTAQGLVWWIMAQAKNKPLGDAQGQRNYYLKKLKIAITSPTEPEVAGKSSGADEYACTEKAKQENLKAVDEALKFEKLMGGAFEDLEENVVATGKLLPRFGQDKKKYYVDSSDPQNIRVKIKIKLKGDTTEVEKIKKLEDAIERASHTKGYWLDIVFVNTSGPDVFEFTTKFCQWANSGNWASGPTTLSHEVHHALGLDDRYDYIEEHANNPQISVAKRLQLFSEQMQKTGGARDKFSKMDTSSNPLLSEDICAVAHPDGPERKKCIAARKSLDPPGLPPI